MAGPLPPQGQASPRHDGRESERDPPTQSFLHDHALAWAGDEANIRSG